VPDVLGGAVQLSRLASHAGVLVGLLLVLLASRAERVPAPRAARQARPAPAAGALRRLGRGAA
jgi:hypothetical protein